MQYDLMRYIAAPNRCLTIVGDPDQSSESQKNLCVHNADTCVLVYGWRAAEVQNLAKMQRGERTSRVSYACNSCMRIYRLRSDPTNPA